MIKNIHFLAAFTLLACPLVIAAFIAPDSIVGTPQLNVPYQITWEPADASPAIKKIRLQLGDGDGKTAVNVLFDLVTLEFPATKSYTYTWPADLPTTKPYTVVLQGLGANDQVLETEYITWFQLTAAPAQPSVQQPTVETATQSSAPTATDAPSEKSGPVQPSKPAPAPTSHGVRDNTLSIANFALALFTFAATVAV